MKSLFKYLPTFAYSRCVSFFSPFVGSVRNITQTPRWGSALFHKSAFTYQVLRKANSRVRLRKFSDTTLVNITKKLVRAKGFNPSNLGRNAIATRKSVPVKSTLLTLLLTAPQVPLLWDMALAQTTGSIGSTVFNDTNANNIQDGTETGISGVAVTLTSVGADGRSGTDDDINRTTRTDDRGNYRFDNLQAGNYTVQITPPDGIFSTTGVTSISVPLEAGQNVTYANFGLRGARGSIGSLVFRDLSGNGILDGTEETGLSGIRINLTGAGADGVFGTRDDIRRTTLTDGTDIVANSTGRYSFDNLPPGQYIVEAVTPAGAPPYPLAFLTTGRLRFNINLQPDQVITGANFGFRMVPFQGANGSIGDTVFEDRNSNGIQDQGEPGIPNVNLTVIGAGPDGQFNTPDDTITNRTTTTNGNGIYGFNDLPPGSYRVTVTPPPGFIPQPTTGSTQIDVTLEPGQNLTTVDFGFRRPGASIGDEVFIDRNNNGIRDQGEPGIPNVTLTLRNPTGEVIGTTTTNSQGIYGFSGLQPGNYTVQARVPNGLSPTNSTIVSPGLVQLPGNITQPDQALLTVDFGFRGTLVGAGVGDLRLIKRITNVFRNGQPTNIADFNRFIDDPNQTNDNQLPGTERFVGQYDITNTPLLSGDEVEYTIYFLNTGTESLQNVRFCDSIPVGTTFSGNLSISGAANQGRALSPLSPLPTEFADICRDRNNANGTVVADLGTIGGNQFGFVRFRVRVN
jgi:uncharacterized repeat protein (TIGR01451 family)